MCPVGWPHASQQIAQGDAGAPLGPAPRGDAALGPARNPSLERAAAPVVAHAPRSVKPPLMNFAINVGVAGRSADSVAAVGLPDEHAADLDVLLPTVQRQLIAPNTGDDAVATKGKQAAWKRRRRQG